MPLMSLSINWTWPRGKKKINECEDVNINFPHWKTKRKNNRWGKKQNLQEL